MEALLVGDRDQVGARDRRDQVGARDRLKMLEAVGGRFPQQAYASTAAHPRIHKWDGDLLLSYQSTVLPNFN